jgi:hypothetical protein
MALQTSAAIVFLQPVHLSTMEVAFLSPPASHYRHLSTPLFLLHRCRSPPTKTLEAEHVTSDRVSSSTSEPFDSSCRSDNSKLSPAHAPTFSANSFKNKHNDHIKNKNSSHNDRFSAACFPNEPRVSIFFTDAINPYDTLGKVCDFP